MGQKCQGSQTANVDKLLFWLFSLLMVVLVVVVVVLVVVVVVVVVVLSLTQFTEVAKCLSALVICRDLNFVSILSGLKWRG